MEVLALNRYVDRFTISKEQFRFRDCEQSGQAASECELELSWTYSLASIIRYLHKDRVSVPLAFKGFSSLACDCTLVNVSRWHFKDPIIYSQEAD